MSDNMQDMLNNVKGMINSGNIPDEIKNILSSMQNSSGNSGQAIQEDVKNSSNETNSNSQISFSPEMMSTLASMFNNVSQNTNTSSNTNISNSNSSTNNSSDMPNFDINTIFKMKNIIDKMNVKDDPRSNLLRSLKPYLRDSRKNKLDQYVNFMKMANVMDFLNTNNKENK